MTFDFRDEEGHLLDPRTGRIIPDVSKNAVSWESIFGPAVHTEAFQDSTTEWRRQDTAEAEERARLIREIEQRKLRDAL